MKAESQVEVGRSPARRCAVGAEIVPRGVHFRVWAPLRRSVEVAIASHAGVRHVALEPEQNGWFSGRVDGLGHGARYRYRLDGGDAFPDPASRFQPDGPHGPSQVWDSERFAWTDADWTGLAPDGQVVYELHVGTFTPEGTWEAAARELLALAKLGVTAIEVMPVSEFSGGFGWGYDGVDLFAPSRLYGTPDDLRRFVDRAHALGLGVILDVVYNHCGPDGCYLRSFSPDYFTVRYSGEWGDPLNFDGERSDAVRTFVTENAASWIRDFHLDGLRLDATQAMFDASKEHIVAEVARRAREAAGGRRILLVAENEPQDTRLVRPVEAGGYGLDLVWNDDFHHSATVAATGRREAYYSDHHGTPQELLSAAKHGYLFQGQRYAWQDQRRGTPARGLPPRTFVAYLENHDQVANSARGAHLHQQTSPGRYRALTALLLLGPWTPMLFQGQEYGSTRPFLYFAEHVPELARKVREGRAEFVRQFASVAGEDMRDRLDDPGARATFERCRLDRAERERHADHVALHRDLLALRRADPVIRLQGEHGLDGAVLDAEAFLLRWFAPDARDRVLVVNLGRDLARGSIAEPLLAPPTRAGWTVAWSSEDPRYGGGGTPAFDDARGIRVASHSALLLAPAAEVVH